MIVKAIEAPAISLPPTGICTYTTCSVFDIVLTTNQICNSEHLEWKLWSKNRVSYLAEARSAIQIGYIVVPIDRGGSGICSTLQLM